jgi:hypothetical protein
LKFSRKLLEIDEGKTLEDMTRMTARPHEPRSALSPMDPLKLAFNPGPKGLSHQTLHEILDTWTWKKLRLMRNPEFCEICNWRQPDKPRGFDLRMHEVFDYQIKRRAPIDFANITNETYIALFDKRAKSMKAGRGLKKNDNLRDKMGLSDLTYVMASESLANERIEQTNPQGPTPCQIAVRRSARHIREAIEKDRADRG